MEKEGVGNEEYEEEVPEANEPIQAQVIEAMSGPFRNPIQEFEALINSVGTSIPRKKEEIEWRVCLYVKHLSQYVPVSGYGCMTWKGVATYLGYADQKKVANKCNERLARIRNSLQLGDQPVDLMRMYPCDLKPK